MFLKFPPPKNCGVFFPLFHSLKKTLASEAQQVDNFNSARRGVAPPKGFSPFPPENLLDKIILYGNLLP